MELLAGVELVAGGGAAKWNRRRGKCPGVIPVVDSTAKVPDGSRRGGIGGVARARVLESTSPPTATAVLTSSG